MSETEQCDVLIVGGGPAGLATAETLAPAGRVIVVHQDAQIGWPVRSSGGSWVADLQALGLPEHLYQRIDALDIRSDSERCLMPLERHKGAVLDITGTYRWQAARAEAAGAEIWTDTKFVGFADTGGDPRGGVVAEPRKAVVAEPRKAVVAEPRKAVVAEPRKAVVAEPRKDTVAEPRKDTVAEPRTDIAPPPGGKRGQRQAGPLSVQDPVPPPGYAHGPVALLRERGQAVPRKIRARYVVDASGTACAVLEAAGLGARPVRQGVGIEYEYNLNTGDAHIAALLMGAELRTGYGWIFPTPTGHLRVGVGVIHPETDASPRTILDRLLAEGLLARHGYTVGLRVQVNAGVIPSVPYDPDLVFGRIVRVGDAGNFATPTVGEGIRIALEQGRVLGEALARTLPADDPLPLRGYARACRRRFARDYALGYGANTRIARYDGPAWDRSLRRLQRLSEEELVALLCSRFTGRMMLRTVARTLWGKLRRT